MATFEQEEELRKRIDKNLKVIIKEYKNADLVRTKDLGTEFDFSNGKEYFNRMIKLFDDLSKIDLEFVPKSTLDKFLQYSNEVVYNLSQIVNFTVSGSVENAKNEINKIIKYFRTEYDNYHTNIIPYLTYSAIKSLELETKIDEFNKTIKKFKDKTNASIEEQNKILEESKSILDSIRQASSGYGVAKYSSIFGTEATFHEDKARHWFWGIIGVSIFTIGAAIYSIIFLLGEKARNLETPQIIQLSIGKIIILSILYYILVLCVRNYNAQRHNFIINKHRQNSLNTFETFVKSAGDDINTKNAILLETTRSIFSAQHSGYIKQDIDSEPPNKFIEIIRNIGGNFQK